MIKSSKCPQHHLLCLPSVKYLPFALTPGCSAHLTSAKHHSSAPATSKQPKPCAAFVHRKKEPNVSLQQFPLPRSNQPLQPHSKLTVITHFPYFWLCLSNFLFEYMMTNREVHCLKQGMPLVYILKTNLLTSVVYTSVIRNHPTSEDSLKM